MIENNQNIPDNKGEECIFHVQGMTCHSCEMLVERSWNKVEGVSSVKADSSLGTVKVTSRRKLSNDELQQALTDQKYKVVDAQAAEKRTKPKWSELAGLFALAAGLAWVITKLGGLVTGGPTGEQVGIGTAVFLGLLASISSCLAVVSGLMISSTAQMAQGSEKIKDKFAPVAMFIIGRFASYALLGGVLGWVGAKLAFSGTTTAIILAIAAVYMILIGLDMLHLLPVSVRKYLPGTPKALTHGVLDKAQKNKGAWLPFVTGSATFFMPCGFTQALQAYALTTGSFWASAAILGAFAIGTSPGLMIFGLAATSFKGKAGKYVFKVAGALVVVLGMLNLNNGIALAGWKLPSLASKADGLALTSVMDEATKEQVVKMIVTDSGYQPRQIVVKAGVPVRWEIDNRARGCASSLVFNKFGINSPLRYGANLFKFTPKEIGRFPFSCSMGMVRGEMIVTDGSVQAVMTAEKSDNFMRADAVPVTGGSSCGGSGSSGGGCGGCGGSLNSAPTEAKPVKADRGTQVFKLTYDSANDVVPNVLRVKSGIPVRLDIDAKENGSGCMSTIVIPGLSDEVLQIRKGLMTIEFTATEKGTYDIECAMGVPRGQVIVE